ncbi:MAG TPA: hypothetical protein VE777_12210 [Gaiellales bacterium]|nr:hypothetical protein [Gaiellales bacterium]
MLDQAADAASEATTERYEFDVAICEQSLSMWFGVAQRTPPPGEAWRRAMLSELDPIERFELAL